MDTLHTGRKLSASVFIRVRPWLVALFVIVFTFRVFSAGTDYKQILIFTNGDSIRVRLPLTDVTGKARVKERAPGGFGITVAPTRTVLGENDYLEWQIGYDVPNTNSPSAVPELKFQSNGEAKCGHELSKIILESVQTGILSTNDLNHEIEALKKNSPNRI